MQSSGSSMETDVAVNRLNAGNISFEGQKIFKVLGGEIKITTVANIQKGNPMGDMAVHSLLSQVEGHLHPVDSPGEFE